VDQVTTQLAEFAGNLRFDDIPDRVVERSKQLLIDTLACGLGGRGCRAASMGLALTSGVAPEGFAGRVVGSDLVTAADMAAFVNTAMIRYLDYNDFYPGGHPSDCLGGLLAVSGSRDPSGRQLLTSMVVAYEVYSRLSDAARFRHRGWDQGAAVAAGLSAGLGNLLQLDAVQIGNAIALATVSCVPLRATRAGQLSLWKGAATAQAAREAVFLTGLAEQGMTGPASAFEGRHGVWDMITGPFELQPFGTDGGGYLLEVVRLKYWPVEYNTQLAVWAALDLRAKVSVEDIATIEIGTYWSAWHETASEAEKWSPTTRETADHSLPYIFARSLVDGRIGLEAIEARYPKAIAMQLTATTRSGETIVLDLDSPRGHEDNPMTVDETNDKFMRMANTSDAAAVERALEFWWALDDQPSLIEGLDLLIL
jgi:2-methylcitrate dehydratase